MRSRRFPDSGAGENGDSQRKWVSFQSALTRSYLRSFELGAIGGERPTDAPKIFVDLRGLPRSEAVVHGFGHNLRSRTFGIFRQPHCRRPTLCEECLLFSELLAFDPACDVMFTRVIRAAVETQVLV